jgi:hypothetical protein
MANKKKRQRQDCDVPNCLVHKLWPALAPALGEDACYHIDPTDGELIVRTGLRILPSGETVQCPWHYIWRKFECPSCKRKGRVRADCLDKGLTTKCPYCSARKPIIEMT